ncbi:tetratricopeptide repeat protein [Corallococcus aberystwythensis]|nr:tetratricopeptide repeat protein [Corallococcus aberystwythensis]
MRSSQALGPTLCWVILVILPSVSLAAPSSEVKIHLEAIANLYEELEYERALAQLATARRQASGPEDDVELSLWEGLLLAELSRTEEAAAAFTSALVLRPDAQFPVKVSPKVSNQLESLRKAVKRTQQTRRGAPSPSPTPRQATDAPREEPPPSSSPQIASSSSVGSASAPPLQVTQETQKSSLRSKAYIPAIAGGALTVAGGVSWALSRGERSKLRNADPSLTNFADVDRAASRGRTLQAAGVGLLGVGVLGLGLATGMYLIDAPEKSVAMQLGTDGRSAFVYGRLP